MRNRPTPKMVPLPGNLREVVLNKTTKNIETDTDRKMIILQLLTDSWEFSLWIPGFIFKWPRLYQDVVNHVEQCGFSMYKQRPLKATLRASKRDS